MRNQEISTWPRTLSTTKVKFHFQVPCWKGVPVLHFSTKKLDEFDVFASNKCQDNATFAIMGFSSARLND